MIPMKSIMYDVRCNMKACIDVMSYMISFMIFFVIMISFMILYMASYVISCDLYMYYKGMH